MAQVNADQTVTYLHTDHLGTPRVASNGSAAKVWEWKSDAFGNGVPTGSMTVNLRFPGQYYDQESKLHYNWNRYYDPKTGRYITSDPIGLEGGINTYGYVEQNPLSFTDPTGEVVPLLVGIAACASNPLCRAAVGATVNRPVAKVA